ncbi:chemotaxis protein CheW [Brucepastera parasyntrophica]|uniref:chemotaxis protein CheW n=1 Tax=Brucepastera parasyntrophica TaxID=2880008 RepID=UPI00210B74B0|nr:chemotaxis protein CheW [Brucepastera parasyntrophica]ULQ58917.1 chemotaxis protein CheW [Brucepastera parasyntrophica]
MPEKTTGEIHQYLTFKLADEDYAINVAHIKEIMTVPRITKMPRMPDYMSGIINLRGNAVPVLDLCRKFGQGQVAMTPNTSIIVLEIPEKTADEKDHILIIGIFSDMVQKVITIEPENIEPPPQIGIAIDTAFLSGMGHIDDSFIMILNINKILTQVELQEIKANTGTVE